MTYLPDPDELTAWDDFPARAHPRPILINPPPLVPRGGFADGDAKRAALSARYELVAALPPDPPPVLTTELPDGPARLPTRTALQALDVLTATPHAQQSGPTLKITRVELGTATFRSDRGPHPLPAWLFTASGAHGPLAVPAIAQSAFWRYTPVFLVYGHARRNSDGRLITVPLSLPDKASPGEPRFRYESAVLESESAVVVGLRAVPDGIEPGIVGIEHDGPGLSQEFTIALASPLGGRVLVGTVMPTRSAVFAVQPGWHRRRRPTWHASRR